LLFGDGAAAREVERRGTLNLAVLEDEFRMAGIALVIGM
jgi:hypothetical protein